MATFRPWQEQRNKFVSEIETIKSFAASELEGYCHRELELQQAFKNTSSTLSNILEFVR